LSVLRVISQYSAWISGAMLLLCALLIGVEVLARNLFRWSFGGVDEISAYVFAIGIAWSFAFTLLGRAHIRIDLIYGRLTPRLRALLDILALASLLAITLLLLQQSVQTVMTSYEFRTRSNTPLGVMLWWPQALWAAGLGFFALVQICLMVRVVALLLRGDTRQAGALAGVRSMDEEIDEE